MFDKTDSEGWTYHGLCPKCGKPYIYVGDVPPGGFIKGQEPCCICNENNYNFNGNSINIFNQGWVCPRCGKVFAPHINECMYCNGVSVSSVWDTSKTITESSMSSTDTVILDEDDDTLYSFTGDKNQ